MRVIKWLFISLCGLAGLLVGAFFAFRLVVFWSVDGVGSDGGVGSAFLRSQFHDGPRYYELTAQLEVEGKPVEIKRVIECLPYFAHRMGNYFQKRWYTNQEAMTHRLPDGSGVIVVVPRLCEEFAYPQPSNAPPWKAFPDLPEDFVPLILWTADADNLEVLEGYHSFESVERVGSRIRFRGIDLKNGSDLEPQVYPEEFGVWANRKFGGLFADVRPKDGLTYVGYYLISIGEDKWRKISELNVGLNDQRESGFLSSSLTSAINENFGTVTDFDQYAIRGSMRVRLRSEYNKDLNKPGEFKFTILDDLFGFNRSDELYYPAYDRQGVISYFVREKNTDDNSFSNIKDVKFIVDEEKINLINTKGYSAFYSVLSKNIYIIRFSVFDFYENR